MNPNQLITSDLLRNGVQYQVPLFQRPQSWTKTNRNALWEDLMSLYDRWDEPAQTTNLHQHFLGAVVLQQQVGQPTLNRYLIIDGQQRLSNLWVILAVIRDQANKDVDTWGTLAEETQNIYITNHYEPEETRYKLLLGSQDQKHLKAITNGQPPEKNSALGKIYDDYNRKLNAAGKTRNGINLKQLRDCVLGGMTVVSIVMQENENPYHIFASLNAKGRQLTKADLIRNFIMMQIDGQGNQEDLYQQYWLPMETRITSKDKEDADSLTEFFARYLSIMAGRRVISKNVYEEMCERHNTNKLEGQDTPDLLQDLHRFHIYFTQVKSITDHKSADVSKQLKYISDWKIDLADPFLMRAIQLESEGHIATSDLLETLNMVQSLIVRRFICGRPPRELGDLFARMARRAPGPQFTDWFKSEVKSLDIYPDDQSFERSMSDYRSSNSKRQRTKLILIGFEKSFANKEAPSTEEAQLEHVMPETLTIKWQEALGPEYESIHKELLQSIGNLSITKSNQTMGNKLFSEKKIILEQSNYELNKGIVKYDKWGKNSINERAESLIELAKETWNIELPE